MFLPLSLGALIVVILVSPFYWAAEHPIAAGFIVAGLSIIGFSFYAQSVQRRARRKFERAVAKREEKIALYREAIRRETADDAA